MSRSQPAQPRQAEAEPDHATHSTTGGHTSRASSGCRAGDTCPYKHEPPTDVKNEKPGATNHAVSTTEPESAASAPSSVSQAPQRRYQAPVVPKSKVVQRPVPKVEAEDPREFQLGQIRRRFSPQEKDNGQASVFTFNLVPSDPDFPYEIEALECTLTVPRDYPAPGRPKLRITNKELQRGFQINVEDGFDAIASGATSATLLGLMNRLDKALAEIFSRPMAETVKIYRPARVVPGTPAVPQVLDEKAVPAEQPLPRRPASPTYSSAERTQAEQRRNTDIRQLKARLGKSPGFTSSSDGISFTLPTSVFRSPVAPSAIRQAASLTLVVPVMYNLAPARITFGGEKTSEVRNVEAAFEQRCRAQKEASLLAHVNHLSLNLKTMAEQHSSSEEGEPPVSQKLETLPIASSSSHNLDTPTELTTKGTDDKPHLHIIPRPIEWLQTGAAAESESGSSDYSDSEDSSEETDTQDHEAAIPAAAPSSSFAEKGVMLSFPNLELYGIELLELQVINLTVKCDRCKETCDIERIRNNTELNHAGMKEQSCRKCGAALAVGYRMDLIHVNSNRAGYLDLDGCTTVDLLPSTFIPTCAECSTAYTTPGCVSVRGDSSLAVCRECHKKMSFRINETKFLHVSASARHDPLPPRRRRPRENLGIVAGTELPRRGRCAHYAKSYRWFRFGCCGKVFPCDRCHDAAPETAGHALEFANRMICGFCSREQNYRPEDCGVCHAGLVGRKGTGFWEGGKGTRDKTRMSRKDPRKYKRRPGTKPSS